MATVDSLVLAEAVQRQDRWLGEKLELAIERGWMGGDEIVGMVDAFLWLCEVECELKARWE